MNLKRFGLILSLFLLITACSQPQDQALDLETLNQQLPYLAEDTFDISNVLSSVEYGKDNIFENLTDVYDYEYEEVLGINPDNVIQGTVRISPTSAQMYMVFKPVSGREEALKQELMDYVSHRILIADNDDDKKLLENALIEQNEDFTALIVSNDNQEVLDRIKNAKATLFGVLTPAEDADLETYGLNRTIVSAYAIQKPVLTSARTYLIVKSVEGHEDEVREALNSYLKRLETDYASMPQEEELVKNAMVTELDGYQIIIISKDNKRVFEAIKTYLQ
ncbi:DUF4358 domain-containing protein [uncultured Traorella sp.]|uniref:DUF4358 domain-containing protein n=1 Tax=uncultured Traorella sp. TaxID=1929048 RepID=UPI0025EA44DF|nr:DUF4358 domain-containing protein [uncultured Traorella sp.]